MNVFCAPFMYLHFVFIIFLAKGNRQKAIRKLLVKLTTRVIRVVKDDLVGRHLR